MPTIALVDDDRNILTSVSLSLECWLPQVEYRPENELGTASTRGLTLWTSADDA